MSQTNPTNPQTRFVTFKKASGAVLGEVEIGVEQTVAEAAEEALTKLGQSLFDASGNVRSFSVYTSGRDGRKLEGELPLIDNLSEDEEVILTSDARGALR